MKWLNYEQIGFALIVFVVVIVLDAGSAKADFTFGTPINMGPTVNSTSSDFSGVISPDGLELYFESRRDGGYGGEDIWVSTRETQDAPWREPMNLGPNVNSSGAEYMPRLSPDGLELYFDAKRSGGQGRYDAWVSKRATKDSDWRPAENFGPPVNTSSSDGTVWITNDSLELYFSSGRPGGSYPSPIYVSTRANIEDDWGTPIKLGPPVEGPDADYVASVSTDGLALFIMEDELHRHYRPGGYGTGDIWITTRVNRSSPWGTPMNLGPIINTSDYDSGGFVSPDGSTFYFDSRRDDSYGGSDLYQAPIIPICDFNGEGNIDTEDLLIMIDNWGTDNSLCDIGPMPWGDGVVDIEDLKVFMEYWEHENML